MAAPPRLAYSPDQARDERGRWTDEGGGSSDGNSTEFVPHGYEIWWSMSGGSEAIVEAAAGLTHAEGWGAYTESAEAVDAARYFLDRINAGAETLPEPMYSGHMRAAPTVGDQVEIPLMSVGPQDLAGLYANKATGGFDRSPERLQGLATDMRPVRDSLAAKGMTPDEIQQQVDVLYRMANRTPTAPPSDERRPQIYTFPMGTPTTPIREDENLVSGRFTVVSVKEGPALNEGWIDSRTDTVHVVHALDVGLRYDGPLPIDPEVSGSTASARVAFSEDQARDEYGRWVEEGGGAVVLTETREHGGITIRPVTGQEPDNGFIVATGTPSRIMTEDEFFADAERGIAAIEEFLTAHAEELSADPDLMLGTWLDREHHEVVLDVVEHVESRDEAVRLGQERDQQAIWDVVAGDEIGTGGSGGREASIEGHGVGEATEAGARHDSGGTARVRGADLPEDGGGTFVEVIEWMLPGGVRVAYSEEQAREPAGSPEGGRWVSTGEGDGEPTRYVYGEKGRVEEYIERNGPTDQADFLKWRAERQWTVPRTKEEFVDRRYEEMRAAFIEREQKGGFGSVLDYWSKGLDFDWEQEQVQAFIDGDPEAVAAIRESLEDHADRAEVDNVDWELQDQVQNAMYAVRDSDGLNAVFDKIGDLPSVYTAHMSPSPKDYAPEDMPTALTDWGGTIWLMDNYVAVGDPPPEPYGPSFPASSWTVREDTAGTIQHEIGHFVYGRMGRDDQASWERTYRSSDSLDVSRYAHEGDTGRRVGDDAPGLDAREGFAETFNAVMSRDYDASAYRDGAQPMLEWMVQFVGEENAGGGI